MTLQNYLEGYNIMKNYSEKIKKSSNFVEEKKIKIGTHQQINIIVIIIKKKYGINTYIYPL